MRILFSFVGGTGHFQPLVPIARQARSAGHAVTVTGQASMSGIVRDAGFEFVSSGPDFGDGFRRLPLLEVDLDREDRQLRESFGRRAAHERAAEVAELCAERRPDLVVRDEIDFGAVIAAERYGVPHANVLVIAAGSFVRTALLSEPLNEVRAANGLAPDPELRMLHRFLVLSPFPPGLRDPRFPLPQTAHTLRMLEPAIQNTTTFPDDDNKSTVYFTLGTVFDIESGDLFSRALAGLRELPVDVIATVGRRIHIAELGPQPENVRIERYLPQTSVLPHCDAVVSHGGSGSVLGALQHGLPMVLLPIGADQPLTAQRCEDLGVARVLDPVRTTPGHIAHAVSEVLSEPGFRRAANALRDELAQCPGPEHAVSLLERLGQTGDALG